MTVKSILLVEDDADSILFVRFALKRLKLNHRMDYAPNALSAMRYLEGEGRFCDRVQHPLPDLILLDLKMPGMDGFELLQWVRTQPSLKHLPICVLTTSTYAPDLAQAYKLGADCYLSKPVDLFVFVESLKSVLERFLPVPDHLPTWTGNHLPESFDRMQAA